MSLLIVGPLVEPLRSETAEQHAKEIAAAWVAKGKEAAVLLLNTLIVEHKIKTFEVAILTSRVRYLLTNNGVILKEEVNDEFHKD